MLSTVRKFLDPELRRWVGQQLLDEHERRTWDFSRVPELSVQFRMAEGNGNMSILWLFNPDRQEITAMSPQPSSDLIDQARQKDRSQLAAKECRASFFQGCEATLRIGWFFTNQMKGEDLQELWGGI